MTRSSQPLPIPALVLMLALLAAPVGAIHEPETSGPQTLAFGRPDLFVKNVYQPLDALPATQSAALEAAAQRLGVAPGAAFYDLRAGRWGTLVLSEPLLPGSGRGNDLTWAELGVAPPQDEKAWKDAAWDAFRGYLEANQADLGLDPDQMSPRVTVHEDGRVIQIYARRTVGGVAVRDAFVGAVINSGNLVLLGSRNWGAVTPSPTPGLSAADASATATDYLRPHRVTGERKAPELFYVPLAIGAEPTDPGAGVGFALVWGVYPELAGSAGTWEALVDAHTGELLLFGDRNRYFDRAIEGGVLPVSNDGLSTNGIPDGFEQPGYPMPFADVFQPFGTSTTSNSAGLVEGAGSVVHTDLSGPFVRIDDSCGPIDESVTCADLDLGTGAGTDCQVPAGRSAGDTRASRTGFFEVNRIIEQARSWLPSNPWLQDQLVANMNLDASCNAFWDGATINFYTSGASGSNVCRNTGEIAAVFDHEWGHGMDDNDALPEISRPGEAPADVYAMVRLNSSCIARGFFENNSIGGLCTGFGDPCTECSGVRDADWQKRSSGLPHDIAWIVRAVASPGVPGVVPPGGCVGATAPIPTISDGPCGQSTHCEGNVVSEAVWDLIQRDLTSAPYGLDVNTTLNLVARLQYLGGGNVNEWYQCDASGALGGCNFDGGYLNYLAIDDDNGDLNDGTPHMAAIHAAFDRHQMACPVPQPVDSGCAGAPASAPVVTGTALDGGAHLSWSAVPGAVEYWVYRTDGIHGCEFGKERIARTAATELTDSGLKPGRDYFYTVEAVGASESCRSAASACETIVPNAPSTPPAEAVLAFREATEPLVTTSGDGDEFLDNCERAMFNFRVENAGSVDLTNVRLVSATAPSHPATVILTPLPSVLASSLTAGVCGLHGSAQGSVSFEARGLGFDEPLTIEFAVTADELSEPLVGTVVIEGTESDFQFQTTKTFSYESDFESWRIVSGVYTRANPGANGTLTHLASSSLTPGACDEIQSPEIKLSASSTLSLYNQFDIEPGTEVTGFYDRANVGLFDVLTGDRVTIVPDGGLRPYNASGTGGACVVASEPGWAGPGPGFVESTWSATALDAATRAGERLRLDVAYGTDPLVEGLGFQFDEVTLTDFELQVPDAGTDVCPEINQPPVAVDDVDTTDAGMPVLVDVLANDSDPENDPLTVVSVTQPANGTAEIVFGGQAVRYTPDPGFAGVDVFTYTVCDPSGGCDTANVTITVRGDQDDEDSDTDDHDSDGVRDDVDSDDDNDGDSDNSDPDDDNDGDSDNSDSDDDNDGIKDEFDSESFREEQTRGSDGIPASGERVHVLNADAATLLLVALVEGPGAEGLVVEIHDPLGGLLAASVSAPGRALATAVPLGAGDHVVTISNPTAQEVAYDLTFVSRQPWP